MANELLNSYRQKPFRMLHQTKQISLFTCGFKFNFCKKTTQNMLAESLKETILLGTFYSKLGNYGSFNTSRETSDGIKNNFLAGVAKLYNRPYWQQKSVPLCSLVMRNGYFFFSTVVNY